MNDLNCGRLNLTAKGLVGVLGGQTLTTQFCVTLIFDTTDFSAATQFAVTEMCFVEIQILQLN